MVLTLLNPFFFPTKMLLSSRAFQISSFRREQVNGSGDMHSRSAFARSTVTILIALSKLAIAKIDQVRVEVEGNTGGPRG